MKLYLDEDISPNVAEFLRKKGTDAVSAHEIRMIGASDAQQLARAASEGRAMVTRNRNDFVALTVQCFQDIKPHHGVLIVPHSIPGYDFSRLTNRLHDYVLDHPLGMQPYTIAFISK